MTVEEDMAYFEEVVVDLLKAVVNPEVMVVVEDVEEYLEVVANSVVMVCLAETVVMMEAMEKMVEEVEVVMVEQVTREDVVVGKVVRGEEESYPCPYLPNMGDSECLNFQVRMVRRIYSQYHLYIRRN
jgi:hypothetical protein